MDENEIIWVIIRITGFYSHTPLRYQLVRFFPLEILVIGYSGHYRLGFRFTVTVYTSSLDFICELCTRQSYISLYHRVI